MITSRWRSNTPVSTLFTFWPPLKAVNQESQQSIACGALCFVVTSIGGSICFSSRIDPEL
jgi:hypothetical protein